MVTIGKDLHQRAVEEIASFVLKISFGNDPVPADAAERTKKGAKRNLQSFLHNCRESAAKIAQEEVRFSADPKLMEQEANFWNMFTATAHDGLVAHGHALGLSKETTEQIIAALSGRHAN